MFRSEVNPDWKAWPVLVALASVVEVNLKVFPVIVPLELISPEAVIAPFTFINGELKLIDPELCIEAPPPPPGCSIMLPPTDAPDPFPVWKIISPPAALLPKPLPASIVKSAPSTFPLLSSGASIFIDVAPGVNTILFDVKVFAVIVPLALILLLML